MSIRLVSASVVILGLALIAAEARRGFSSGGAGSGSYDGGAATTSWDLSATPDADCIAIFAQACAALTPAQTEEVASRTAAAQAANYANHADYVAANAQGYTLSPADGTLWSHAKSPGGYGGDTTTDAQWDGDCDASFSSSGGCDGLTKTQFNTINDDATGRVSALAAGYSSYHDWHSASALGYTMSAADAGLWGNANDGSVSPTACDAEFAGRACHELTKAGFQNARDSNALITAKIAKVTAGTLTHQDMVDLSISFANSALPSPVTGRRLDYLETVLGTSASTTKADWQATIDGYSETAASKWYVYQIAGSADVSGPYAPANASQALLDACGLDVAGANATLGPATDAQIAAHIRHANSDLTSLSGAPTNTQLKDFLTEAVGFANGTRYADVAIATGANGWLLSDYRTATRSTGWTNSAAHSTKFAACRASANSSDGSGGCGMALTEWEALAAIEAIAADSNPDYAGVSGTQFASIVAAGSSATANLNLSQNALHLDYMRACVGGLASKTVGNIAACATASNATSSAALYGLGNWSSAYTLDDELLEEVGLTPADADLYADSAANSCFGTSCNQVIVDYLSAPGNSIAASSSAAQISAALDTAFNAHYTIKANAVAPVTNANAPTGNSCALVTATAPSLCSHQPRSHVYCTLHTPRFSINAAFDTISYDGATKALGATTFKDYVLKYKSRRNDAVLRTETRRLKIVRATSAQSTAWRLMQHNSTCPNARNKCINAGGTVGTTTDLTNNNSLVSTRDYVLATAGGTDYNWNKYSCYTSSLTCRSLGGSNYIRRSCTGTSFANLKVLCNAPICN